MKKMSEFSNMIIDDIMTAKSVLDDIEDFVYGIDDECDGNPSLADKKNAMKYIGERIDGFDELCPFMYMIWQNWKTNNGGDDCTPITN